MFKSFALNDDTFRDVEIDYEKEVVTLRWWDGTTGVLSVKSCRNLARLFNIVLTRREVAAQRRRAMLRSMQLIAGSCEWRET